VTGVPPDAVRRFRAPERGATRLVLVRHGQARCNVDGVVGGVRGCTGLTAEGVAQAAALAERLAATGGLAGVGALYSSVLPRAVETARILAPALDRWRDGPPLELHQDCGLCELHPGEADGLTWEAYGERGGVPDWGRDPTAPFAPGGESWASFTGRATAALRAVVDRHPGQRVVVVCHAGVIEAAMQAFLPVDPGRVPVGWLRVDHAAMTEFEHAAAPVAGGDERWTLVRFNDRTRAPGAPGGDRP
jgi:broad specificity phosphatase PhoE